MTEMAAGHLRSLEGLGEITNDCVIPYYLEDRRLRLAIARIDDDLYAFDDLCTCSDEHCPLSGGLVTGTTIMCQCHGSRYQIRTGAVIAGPATEALTVYEVHEVDGTIELSV
jgi:3-phenylpropionate/trans-cinnamate dioxygenase ferredoxin component